MSRARTVTSSPREPRLITATAVAKRGKSWHAFVAAGDQSWAIRAFRELDDVLLRLRFNEPEIGTVMKYSWRTGTIGSSRPAIRAT